jgi:hypothetical protein
MEKDLGMADAKITVDTKGLQTEINKQFRKSIGKNALKIQATLDAKIGQIVLRRLLTGLPTIQGQDLASIGVPDINTRLVSIAQAVADNVRVKVIPSGSGKSFRVNVIILDTDYSDILSLPEAVYAYTSAKGGGILEWLRWILLGGSGTIIGGFSFSPIPSQFSRTDGGLMLEGGSGWKVPESLAGTADNNILTRSLENIQVDILSIIQQELRRIFK